MGVVLDELGDRGAAVLLGEKVAAVVLLNVIVLHLDTLETHVACSYIKAKAGI